jgi:hypothetical protein
MILVYAPKYIFLAVNLMMGIDVIYAIVATL